MSDLNKFTAQAFVIGFVVSMLLALSACSTATHTPERAGGHSGPETRGVVSMVDAPGRSSDKGAN